MQTRVLSPFSPISGGPYARSRFDARSVRAEAIGVRRTGSSARTNDAEDNDRSAALTPKEMERRGDFD